MLATFSPSTHRKFFHAVWFSYGMSGNWVRDWRKTGGGLIYFSIHISQHVEARKRPFWRFVFIMSFDSSRGPPQIEGMTSLKVDNLTYRTTTGDLTKVFSKYGELGDVYIPRDRYKQESRGFAFVRFHEKRDAEDAMDSLHGTIIDGREIRVQMAKYGRPSESYKPRNRYRNSNYGSSRYRSRSRSPRRR